MTTDVAGPVGREASAATHQVVVNAEEQFSLWPLDRPLPAGWKPEGVAGSRERCLAHIAETWTDLTPASLRAGERVPAARGHDPRPADGSPRWWHEAVEAPYAETGVSGAVGERVPVDDVGIHTLIDDRNARAPHEIAVRYGRQTITRAELDARTAALARRLVGAGARPDHPVAVLLPRSADAVVAIIAVLRSGAPYLALSVNDPQARMATILRDAGDPLVVTDAAGRERLADYGGTVVIPADGPADEDAKSTAGHADALPTVTGAHLAYISYTSGTTGAPKGVLGTHSQLVNYVRWCADEFAIAPGERALLHAPLYFVGSVMTLFTALAVGWELDVAPEPVAFDDLADLARAGSCGFLKLTPSHVRALTALGTVDGLASRVMIGSEPLHLTPAFAAWIAGSPGARFANHYGMSETCGCTWHWVGGDEPEGERLPVGRPIHNAEVHIVGSDGERLPHGEVGELCIAGTVTGRGYHGRPALTAERWTPHPWGRPGERLLHTGDLARMTADGTVEVLGRGDRQVKIRGHRIELPTVEDALLHCPGVLEAVVSATPDEGGSARLTAYIRPAEGAGPQAGELREQLLKVLPEPSVPSRFVLVPGFPQTPNGKIDYARLAESPVLRPDSAGPYRAPRTPAEESLCAVFARVLQLDRAGADDDFFELGGDSLNVVQVVTAVEDLGIDLTIGELFDARTPAALAALIGDPRTGAPAAGAPGGHASADVRLARQPVSAADELRTAPDGDSATLPVPFSAEPGNGPMTWGQLHIWRPMQWFGADSAAFNIKRVVPLPERGVPLSACRTALRRLIEAHQALRTRFTEQPDGTRQIVAASSAHLVEVHPLPEGADPQEAAAEQAGRLAAIPFRLSSEWPVRFSLVCRDGQVYAVAVVASHVAVDGWGIERITTDLAAMLVPSAAPQGAPAGSPAASWQPLEQAAFERSERGRRKDARAMEFWRERLAEVPDTAPARAAGAPADPPVQRWVMRSTALAAASAELGRRTRTSSSTVLLALSAVALSALRAEPVVALQLIAGNRYTPRQQQLVSAAAQDALLVFRQEDASLDDTVRTVYRQATEGYFHGQYDPLSLAALLDEVRRSRRHPLDLSGYFNDARLGREWYLPSGPDDPDPLTPRSARGPVLAQGFQRHDMTFCLSLAQRGAECEVSLLADTAHLPQERVPAVLTGLESLLCDAVDREVPLSEIPAALGLAGLARPAAHHSSPTEDRTHS